jgi:hypothetical protein
MIEEIKNTIFKTANGDIYEAYEIDRKKFTIFGYKLFPIFGESLPYRKFYMGDVMITSLRKE